MSFSQFGLNDKLLEAIKHNHYHKPTPIQEKVIPAIFKYQNIMAKAQTGSGKTASFVLPILQKWQEKPVIKKAKIYTLVLTPTRELTLQVAHTFELLSSNLEKKPKVVSVIGGQSLGEQMLCIQKGCDIVVATSGRLLEIIQKRQIDLNSVEFFVLDEADKMLDLGFAQELESVLECLPEKRQNLLFSATYPTKMMELSLKIAQDFKSIEVESSHTQVQEISQRVIDVNKENKSALLRHLIQSLNLKQVLVFMSTKRATDNIAAKFRKHGISAESFHGDLVQDERNWTLDAFKCGELNVLFATDIAARGLHIDNIDCVINFDLPRSALDYTHRIGRTGRARKEGLAISFVDLDSQEHFKLIKKRCKLEVTKEQIEGYKLKGEIPKKVKGQAPVKGKRKSKKDKLREQGKL